jgi:hypothetical protein
VPRIAGRRLALPGRKQKSAGEHTA